MTPRAFLGQMTRWAFISAADLRVAPTKYPLVATTNVAAVQLTRVKAHVLG